MIPAHRTVPSHRRPLGLAALLLAALGAAAPRATAQQEPQGRAIPARDAEAARQVLESFDAAWAAADLDAIMAPISSAFGCEIYGKVDPHRLRQVFEDLIGVLAGAKCSTHVFQFAADGPVIQAYVCRRFLAAGEEEPDARPIEELCHLVYLRREGARMRIVGLEEFEHEGFEAVRGRRYRNPATLLAFDVPERAFFVPRPRVGFFIEHLLLRLEQLQVEIEICLMRTSAPFRLETALDHDLADWARKQGNARVEQVGAARVAGLPGRRAVARYVGSDCSLSGSARDEEPRRLERIYVQIDPLHLLAVDMRCPRRLADSAGRQLERLLQSLRVELPAGLSYGDALAKTRGLGPLDGGLFEDAEAGIRVAAPPGFALERIQSGSLFTLRAVPPGEQTFHVQIDGMQLIDPEQGLDEIIAVDDAAYCRFGSTQDLEKQTRSRQVGGVPALEVDRRLPATPAAARPGGLETVVYVNRGPYVFTIRVVGSLDDMRAAAADLEAVLRSISLDPPAGEGGQGVPDGG